MGKTDQNATQQLEAITGKLASLLDQLAERREKCTTRAERKHLDRLRRDARKQVSAIIKLQQSVDNANVTIAKSSQALETAEAGGGTSRQSHASDVNSLLFRAVAGPFHNQHRLRPLQQRRSPELSQILKPWKQTKSASTANTCDSQSGPTTTLEHSTSTSSNDSGSIDAQSARPETEVRAEVEDRSETEAHPASGISQAGNTPDLVPSREATASYPSSDSDSYQDPHSGSSPSLSSSTSSSSSSLDLPPEVPDQDLRAEDRQPPPLPRKSSRRVSRIPRVPSSPQRAPPPPPLPLAPPPLVPRTPHASVRESWASSSSSSSSRASTTDKLAEDLLSGLEKRYSLTITRTVSVSTA
ncbi:hypothetical protein A1O7_09844 [Cladophialophora yegresii CBS 114405]|uniref:Uncharacterized protein n=1 Tax=Cladophialophora yegresii CBS 114405 TaxID=1182544 RepID=W9W7G7_9EURO|nr:uncharacterized protein A1O7_09844 [Cladophialophora yegresii CBS 114405]EXJ54504.1 hypothetical protein A1O7_09844 [Cladophialophora yegresii CBS 114405]